MLGEQTGLISTFLVKLVTLKDQAILKRVFQVIGNLAHLKQLQSDYNELKTEFADERNNARDSRHE